MSFLTNHTAASIPLLREIVVDPVRLKRVSRVDRLGNLGPKNLSISTLLPRVARHLHRTCAETGVLNQDLEWEICAEIRTFITQRYQVLVALVDVRYLPALKAFFGKDSTRPESGDLVQVIGERLRPSQVPYLQGLPAAKAHQLYPGNEWESAHVPVAICPSAWCQSWCAGNEGQRDLIRLAFSGVDSVSISTRNYAALRGVGARVIPSSVPYRLLRSPKFWAYAIVFFYSSLRALPVMLVPNFRGSVLLLWLMDVVTAVPYTWGLIAFVAGHRAWERYLGLVVTLVTFMTPYIYFWTHGRHYPMLVNVVVVCLIAAAVGWELRNYLRDQAVAVGLKRRRGL